MKTLFFLLLVSILSLQCASPREAVKHSAHLPQIIFVPGYYGSYLNRLKDNKRVWFTLGEALWGDQTLALTEDGIQIPGSVPLKVDGVFDSIGLIPGILSKDIYGKIIASLEENFLGQANIVPFAYDWRQDITQSSKQLAKLVDDLYSKGAPKVAIVAHSMGGLITSYYLLFGDQYREDPRPDLAGAKRLNAVVMAAVPFQGTMTVFRNMQFGVSFGLNTKALENHAVASFPSSYQLLPQYSAPLSSTDGQDLSGWIFEADKWKKYGWGLFRDQVGTEPTLLIHRKNFTRKMLLLGKTTFKNIHDYKTDLNSTVPLLYFFSAETPTINQAIWYEKEKTLLFPEKNLRDSLKNFDEKRLLDKGDGTVTKISAQPPRQFATTFPNLEIRSVIGEHLELLKQERTIKEMIEFLQKELHLSPSKYSK
jgi:pimeloyl-ACP methyl ester carboxylesterase